MSSCPFVLMETTLCHPSASGTRNKTASVWNIDQADMRRPRARGDTPHRTHRERSSRPRGPHLSACFLWRATMEAQIWRARLTRRRRRTWPSSRSRCGKTGRPSRASTPCSQVGRWGSRDTGRWERIWGREGVRKRGQPMAVPSNGILNMKSHAHEERREERQRREEIEEGRMSRLCSRL